MMEQEAKIHQLDAAYQPFPTFADWTTATSVDTVRWNRYTAELQPKSGATEEALRRAREVVKRAAAFDTGAIEGLYETDRGFTFTVAFETAAWEVQLAQKGEKVRSLFEAQMHAYDYVLDLATQKEPISEAAIRVLHEVVCRAQDTYRVMTAVGPQEQELVKGRYKVLPNHVRTRDAIDHSYAPVDVTPAEMQRLIEEMRRDAFLSAHPVMQAAYAHYALVVIHPFSDGNGRVARALASAFTYRAISMPIMILSEQKDAYLNSLEAADRGDYQAFVDFLLTRSLDTLQLVRDSLVGTRIPSIDEAAAAVEGLFVTKGGYTQNQVDSAGGQLLQLITGETSKVAAAKTSANLTGNATIAEIRDPHYEPDAGYRLLAQSGRGTTALVVSFNSSPPAQANVHRNFALWLPRDAASDDDLQLVLVQVGTNTGSSYTKQKYFSARIDELIPSFSGVLAIRASLLAERLVSEMLTELRPLAETALKGKAGS